MDGIAAVIGTANFAQLDELARIIWHDYAQGQIDDHRARALIDAVEARRDEIRSRIGQGSGKGISARQRPPTGQERRNGRSPDRTRSIARRRQMAASGAVPGTIAVHFTVGEIAVLTVIAREVQRSGRCCWPMDRIAAVAGVCRTTVRNAIRLAQRRGLIAVQERRIDRWRSDTNVITVISVEWRAWLRIGGGRKIVQATNNQNIFHSKKPGIAGVSGTSRMTCTVPPG